MAIQNKKSQAFPGGRGFESEKFSTAFKEKCRGTSRVVLKRGTSRVVLKRGTSRVVLKRGSSRVVLKKPEAARRGSVYVLFHINFCKNSRCLLYL